jgi:CubicO group peptidase (beta-lactamase class C family)
MFLMLLLGPFAPAAEPTVQERIRQIKSGLLPPVLVKGEPPSTSTLPDRMQALHVPGVSVAVIHRGKIEWARGFGDTSKGGPPVDSHTLFQAASISKVVAAVAAMKLVQAGKIDLSADANRYLKVWKVPSSPYTDNLKITVLDLLTHTSGITENHFPGYVAGAALPTLVQMLNGDPPANNKPIRVDILPGKSWRYSGGNFLVVQQLLTDVTETDFQELATDLVLVPFGMHASTFAFPLPTKLASHAAMAYRSDGEPVVGGPRVHPESATAGLWSTPSDLAKLAIGIQVSLSGKNKRVISPSTARLMLTPVNNQQAIGFVVGGSTDRKYFNHGGVNFGYRCLLVAYQEGDGVTEERIQGQTAAPASEVALRRLIAALANGKPNYDEMVPAYAETNRQQLPMLTAALDRLGNVESVVFKSVGAAGQDVFDVTFEHGSREFKILLESDGRVHAAEFSP